MSERHRSGVFLEEDEKGLLPFRHPPFKQQCRKDDKNIPGVTSAKTRLLSDQLSSFNRSLSREIRSELERGAVGSLTSSRFQRCAIVWTRERRIFGDESKVDFIDGLTNSAKT